MSMVIVVHDFLFAKLIEWAAVLLTQGLAPTQMRAFADLISTSTGSDIVVLVKDLV